MNQYLGIQSFLNFFGGDGNPLFAQFYNELLSINENQNLDMRGAAWGETQDVFTYEMFEQFNDMVEVMATFVDLDSDPYPIGGEIRTRKMTGSIPRHKALITLNEADIRNKTHQMFGLLNATAITGGNVADTLRDEMEKFYYTKLSSIPNAHKNTLNFMLGKLKSSLDITLNERNNPQGIKGLTFKSHVPDNHRITEVFWTLDTNGRPVYDETKDPAQYYIDLIDSIKNADHYQDRYENVTVEFSRKTFRVLMKHPAWAKHIALVRYSQFYFNETPTSTNANILALGNTIMDNAKNDDAKLIEIFKEITGANEVLLNTAVVSAEHIVKMTDAAPFLDRPIMDAFDYGKALVRPSGTQISIIPVAPMRADSSAEIARMYDGRGLIEYWYDKREKVQTWRSELTCIPVFLQPSRVYSINMAQTLLITPTTLNFTASSTTAKTVTVNGKSPYSASADESWLTATVSGNSVSVKPKSANSGAERTATVTITDLDGGIVTVAVTQAAGN